MKLKIKPSTLNSSVRGKEKFQATQGKKQAAQQKKKHHSKMGTNSQRHINNIGGKKQQLRNSWDFSTPVLKSLVLTLEQSRGLKVTGNSECIELNQDGCRELPIT